MKVIDGKNVVIKNWASELEKEAEKQVQDLTELPFVFHHVAVMPDAHAGLGSTVGTVLATKGAIIPSTVGVDLGCGMAALKLPFSVDLLGDAEQLKKLRHSIERSVPVGFNQNHNVSPELEQIFKDLGTTSMHGTGSQRDELTIKKAMKQLGTLGGGNHFIEICKDQNNDAWIMLHSGSRNIGKVLADKHISISKETMEKYFISVPNSDLSYLVQDTPEFKSYIKDLMWAQNYALANRNEMMDRVLREVMYHVGQLNEYKENKDKYFRVNCHHNYTAIENHFGSNVYVTRKGAVSAKEGEWGIIPGSMGAKSFIVQGLGNPESFHSCSHGAGRKMSRTKAKELFTTADLIQQTEGVECRKDAGAIDEIPAAYKNIDTVMKDQEDLVKPVFELKQLICIKG